MDHNCHIPVVAVTSDGKRPHEQCHCIVFVLYEVTSAMCSLVAATARYAAWRRVRSIGHGGHMRRSVAALAALARVALTYLGQVFAEVYQHTQCSTCELQSPADLRLLIHSELLKWPFGALVVSMFVLMFLAPGWEGWRERC